MEKDKITIEEIEKVMTDMFYGKSYQEMREKKIPYIRQTGENSWEIFSGESTIRCNNAGKALFDKAMQEQMSKILKNGE